MLKGTLPVATLKMCCDILTELDNEATFTFNEGITINLSDASNVALASIDVGLQAFESYECDRETELGMPLEKLSKIVGFGDTGQLISFELDEETRQLEIDVDDVHMSMSLIDPASIRTSQEPPDVSAKMKTTFATEAGTLKRAYKATEIVFADLPPSSSGRSSFVSDADSNTIELRAEGDTDDVDFEFNDSNTIMTDVEATSRTLISNDYLYSIIKPIKKSTEVTVKFGNEAPVVFHHEFGAGVEVKHMLAPRIESQ